MNTKMDGFIATSLDVFLHLHHLELLLLAHLMHLGRGTIVTLLKMVVYTQN